MDESLRREQKQTRTTRMEGMNERMDGMRNPNTKQIKKQRWAAAKSKLTGSVAVT